MTESGKGAPDGSTTTWLLWVMLGIGLWALICAAGLWLAWNDRYRTWRVVVLLGAVALFLGGWALLLLRGRSKAR